MKISDPLRRLTILLLSLWLPATASSGVSSLNHSFEQGQSLYQAGQYDEAITHLNHAVQNEPNNARYHHVLAMSYGREAERAGWFKAMNYAKKTLAHLQTAVRLEPDNVEYLDHLMDYYLEAPGFLGGDKNKAASIQEKINRLKQVSRAGLYSYEH